MSLDLDAILFDFDGVIVDSVPLKEVAFREIIARRAPPHAVEEVMQYYHGNGGTSRLAKFEFIWANILGTPLDAAGIAELGDAFSSRVEDLVVACNYVAGAKEFIERHAESLPLFVISGTPQAELRRIVDRRGLTDCFRGVYGSPPGKVPIGRVILESHGFSPGRVWFVGDATTDRDAARALGTPFVGIHGPHLTPFLDGSEQMIHDLTELESLLPH